MKEPYIHTPTNVLVGMVGILASQRLELTEEREDKKTKTEGRFLCFRLNGQIASKTRKMNQINREIQDRNKYRKF